jgi:hypothetical protein
MLENPSIRLKWLSSNSIQSLTYLRAGLNVLWPLLVVMMMMMMMIVTRETSDNVASIWSGFEGRTCSVRVRGDTHVPIHPIQTLSLR